LRCSDQWCCFVVSSGIVFSYEENTHDAGINTRILGVDALTLTLNSAGFFINMIAGK